MTMTLVFRLGLIPVSMVLYSWSDTTIEVSCDPALGPTLPMRFWCAYAFDGLNVSSPARPTVDAFGSKQIMTATVVSPSSHASYLADAYHNFEHQVFRLPIGALQSHSSSPLTPLGVPSRFGGKVLGIRVRYMLLCGAVQC